MISVIGFVLIAVALIILVCGVMMRYVLAEEVDNLTIRSVRKEILAVFLLTVIGFVFAIVG